MNQETASVHPPSEPAVIKLFLAGDVMTGRGIDQILPYPNDPELFEPYMQSARGYVELAEHINGPIPAPVDFAYIWGDALPTLARMAPDVRIINLETAITRSAAHWPGKAIHYRMHPANVPVLTAANIDCCVVANNHVLDWGYAGLTETLHTLHQAGLKTAGAGTDLATARAPSILHSSTEGRVLVFAFGMQSSGIPGRWAAMTDRAGINLLREPSVEAADAIVEQVQAQRREGDLVVVSIHWGGNWGYAVTDAEINFAHRIIDKGGADVIHGHSSHHAKGVEIYRGRPILYGCGDLINDYEGISGLEEFRGDLCLLYVLSMNSSDQTLCEMRLVPMRVCRFRLNQASDAERQWLRDILDRESRTFGARVDIGDDGDLLVCKASESLQPACGALPHEFECLDRK